MATLQPLHIRAQKDGAFFRLEQGLEPFFFDQKVDVLPGAAKEPCCFFCIDKACGKRCAEVFQGYGKRFTLTVERLITERLTVIPA